MADNPRSRQAFIAGPKGRKPTRAEAEAMAAALFDEIERKRAEKAKAPK